MTIKRLDHVSVVVDDLAAAIAFFTVLGMTIEGESPVEEPWVDRVNGIENVQVDIVMRIPDGHGRLELKKFRNPKLVESEPAFGTLSATEEHPHVLGKVDMRCHQYPNPNVGRRVNEIGV
jgi:catechol 2,3-dioxygenase-like lactoylglutathione lyase family enzyme